MMEDRATQTTTCEWVERGWIDYDNGPEEEQKVENETEEAVRNRL